MDRVSLLGPLALLGCSAIVVGLVYLAARRFGFAYRPQAVLRYVPGISSSSLPAPANASVASLSSSLSRTVKTAKSTMKNATHLSVPKALGSRWSQIMAFFARRHRKRIMLEELPTTASSDDESTAPKTESPVLVDLTETSSVSSPRIPLLRLGATSPPLRSPTPLLASVSSLLATPPLTAASSSGLSRDSPPPPSTPPPQRGVRHSFIPVSPFSSPPFKATQSKAIDLQDLYPVMRQTTGLIYPHSRARTPSPVSHNPYFLSTSPIPISPFRYHRRTRSLGGLNATRMVAPSISADVFNDGPGLLELNNPASPRRLTSRSTELLIDLENGGEVEGEAVPEETYLPSGVLVQAGGGSDDYWDGDLEVPSPGPLPSRSDFTAGHVVDRTEAVDTEGPSARVEFPKIVSNNAWREWDDLDETGLLSLHLDEPSPLQPILPIPTTTLDLLVPSSQDPFMGISSPTDLGLDLFENPFDEPDEGDPIRVLLCAAQMVPDSESRDTESERNQPILVDDGMDWGRCEVEDAGEEKAEQKEEEEKNMIKGQEEEGEGLELERGEEIVPTTPCGTHISPEEQTFDESSVDLFSSHMPTPPASPPFPLLRVPSDVSPVAAHNDVCGTNESMSNVPREPTELLDKVEYTAEVVSGASEGTVETFIDDPPLPEIISQDTGTSKISPPQTPPLPTSSLVPTSNEIGDDLDDMDAVVEGELVDSEDDIQDPPDLSPSPSLDNERSRPAWSLRAAEAPRLGMAPEAPKETDEAQVPDGSHHQEHEEAAATQPFDQIPGAFPTEQTEQLRLRKPVIGIPQEDCKQSTPSMAGRSSAIDTSSFAAAILSLRRKPEPLDVALAMQMRPGLGAGADPAWMVRFMMSVFGWLAVAMSAGID